MHILLLGAFQGFLHSRITWLDISGPDKSPHEPKFNAAVKPERREAEFA